jgi:hypothetical protein
MCLAPSPKTPPAPTKRETLDTNTTALDAREQERRRLSRQRGYSSTMLTGPSGVQAPQQSTPGKTLLGQ